MTDHLGYEQGDPAGGSGDSRNRTTPKTVSTEVGDVRLDQPRGRKSTFVSALVPKGARRLGGPEEMIIGSYPGGMTICDIQHHLTATLGTELSHETISNVTDTSPRGTAGVVCLCEVQLVILMLIPSRDHLVDVGNPLRTSGATQSPRMRGPHRPI